MNSKCEPIEAWHFLNEDKRLRYNSNRLVYPGQTIKVKGKLSPCNWGLHASIKAIDALRNAPGPIICRVLCSDEVILGDDKICARKRKCLWMADATKVLQKFSLDCFDELIKNSSIKEQDLQNIENYRNFFQGKIDKNTFNVNCSIINYAKDSYNTVSDVINSYSYNSLYMARRISELVRSNTIINQSLEDLLWTLKP
jgi:hypothetical protein